MSEDIKGMLDNLKEEIKYWSKIDGRDYTQIGLSNIKKFEDYITNLQQYYNDNVNKYEDLIVKYSDLQEENERLNNIINELENELYKFYAYEGYNDEQIKDKLQELKGSNDNG